MTPLPRREPDARQTPNRQLRRCRSCGAELLSHDEVRWECDCGVAVCRQDECFDEFFKMLADGESTRCRNCGNVV